MPIYPNDPVSAASSVTSAVGVFTATANSILTSFSFAHGLSATPTHVTITAKNLLSSGSFYLTYDATNITISFITAPAIGTISLSWGAFK